MGTTLNKDAYKKLIKEDMEKVEKYFPEHSLEKKHIQEVLKCSIECYYPCESQKDDTGESNCTIFDVSVSLPNEIDLGVLANLLKYSDKYEISIQFWPDQIAVFICKDGVDLKDFGGGFEFAVSKSISYLDRITGNER